MQRLIDYAVEMMIEENYDSESNPTQNPLLHPTQNPELHNSQNIDINATQNWELASSQNPEWRQAWWDKFKELIIWEYMTDNQKKKCLIFLKRI